MEEKENTYVQSTRWTKMYSHCLKWQAHCAKTMCMTKGNCATKCPSFWRLNIPEASLASSIVVQDFYHFSRQLVVLGKQLSEL